MNTSNPDRSGHSPDDPPRRPATGQQRQQNSPAGSGAMQRIGEALDGLRYGSVLVIVQDGVVIQIERTEKTRIGKTDR